MTVQPMIAAMQTTAAAGTSPYYSIAMMVALFAIFYFLLIRPQQKRAREHRGMVDAVKRGDRVVTGGGLVGKIAKVSDTEVQIDLADGVRVTAIKATLQDVKSKTAPKAANDVAAKAKKS
jgi:preprotein translocase subunit YajC